MNKARRKAIYSITIELENTLNNFVDDIEKIKDIEEEAKDNIADYPQFEMKAMDMEMAIDSMEEATTSIKDAIESLKEARQ